MNQIDILISTCVNKRSFSNNKYDVRQTLNCLNLLLFYNCVIV